MKLNFHRPKSAKKVAENYSSYSDYARNASKSEKEKVIKSAILKANKMQRAVASGHSR